ncbi:MAG: MFS transporter [Burkholderiales bacterium]|nr:MFS transporter [Burkholderiales bacterium]
MSARSVAASAGHRRGRAPYLWRRVCALGVAQIVSWGTLFYTIAVLGSAMRADTGVGELWLFGSFTAGLFVSGIVSPLVGRAIDARGGRGVLAAGSLCGALACAVLAAAQGPVSVLLGWVLAGVAMAGCLYDPAFATLHQMSGGAYRRAVTALTLFGGFASTVFWPLSLYLQDTVGWRMSYAIYAVLHLALCLPIHVFGVPVKRRESTPECAAGTEVEASVQHPHGGPTFVWLAVALSLAAFISSAISAHLIGLLTATGLAARDAVLIGSLIGPMQVAGRIMEFSFNRHVRALAVGSFAFALMAVALAAFTQVRGVWIVALAFVIAYGWANGIMTIVRGTVPAELFGQRDYGALLGRLALPQFVFKAVAPFALTLLFLTDPARVLTPYALLLLGVLALVAYRTAASVARQR